MKGQDCAYFWKFGYKKAAHLSWKRLYSHSGTRGSLNSQLERKTKKEEGKKTTLRKVLLIPGKQLWSWNYELGLQRQAMKLQALEFLPIPPSPGRRFLFQKNKKLVSKELNPNRKRDEQRQIIPRSSLAPNTFWSWWVLSYLVEQLFSSLIPVRQVSNCTLEWPEEVPKG